MSCGLLEGLTGDGCTVKVGIFAMEWNVMDFDFVNGSIVRYPNNCHEIDCHGLLFGVSGILFVAMEWFHHGLLIVVRR